MHVWTRPGVDVTREAQREIGAYLAQFLDGLAAPLTFEQVDEISTCLTQCRAVLDPVNDDDGTRAQLADAADCLDMCLTSYEAVYWRTVAVELILSGAEPWHVPTTETRAHIALMLLGGHVRFDRATVDDEIRRRRTTEKGHNA